MSCILFLEDLAKGTRINRFVRKFRSCLSASPDEILDLQNKKMRRLITHAFQNIPWYSSAMKRLGMEINDIQVVEDARQLPILTRNDIQQHLDELQWMDYPGKVVRSSSSGTTGTPIAYYKDIDALSAGIAAGPLLFGFSGWRTGMRTVHIWGNIASVKHWDKGYSILKKWIYAKKNIPSVLINDPDQVGIVFEQIRKFRPQAIDGYANSIVELAAFIEKNNLSLPSVKFVFTTAENLEPHKKKLIERNIAPVSDLYGCGEINGIAGKPIRDDKYYILDPHVLVETLPAENGGEMKEILVTDLDNFYMPFIRYKIGDMVDEIKPASINNPFPFNYFTRIYGRSADHVVLPGGKKLFPVNMFGGTLYRKYPSITRHKVVWDGKKLQFVFECEPDLDMASLARDIGLSLRGYEVEYELKTTTKILPGPSGKYRYFETI